MSSNYSTIITNTKPILFTLRNLFSDLELQPLFIAMQQWKTSIKLSSGQDSRGTTQTITLGHYMERGGQNRICESKYNNTPIGQTIYKTLQNIVYKLTKQMNAIDPQFHDLLLHIPQQYRTLGIFSTFFGNLQPPKYTHRDQSDYKWSILFPFGTVSHTGLFLPYLNTYVYLNIGDAVVMQANEIWHKAEQNVPVNLEKYTGILTTHKLLLKQFIDV
jgi:hypothetical protein